MASLRYLLASCALSSLLVAATSHAQPAATLTAEIAPQPLAQALASYANQTGLQLVYVSRIVTGQQSKGASAGLPLADALTELLDGTGLRFEFLNDRTVRIYAAAIVQPAALRVASAVIQTAENRPAVRSFSLGTIVVTATRREESANKVPISMAIWSREAMEKSGIKGMTEIGALTPGVEFDYQSDLGADIQTNLVIRGLTDRHGTTTGVFIDDTPIRAARGDTFGRSFPVTFDLDRVEVLRGPQGALLGSGTLGGAVRFILNQPSLTSFTGLARAEWATTARGDMSCEIGAATGGPIIPDVLGFRASGWYRSDGGYVDHVDPLSGVMVDENANRVQSKSARVAVIWAPTGSSRVTPSLIYESFSQRDPSSFFSALSDPQDGVLRNASLVPQPVEDSFLLGSVKLTADFAGATLSAATSFFHRTANADIDLDPAPAVEYSDATTLVFDLTQSVFSQEVRLTSADPDAMLTWIAGAFYSHERKREASQVVLSLGQVDSRESTLVDQSQIEGFGQVGLRITKHLAASAGVRIGRSNYDALTEGPPISRAGDIDTVVLPKFDVSFRSDAGSLLYFTVGKGYRNGGIYPPVAGFGGDPLVFPPDTVWSYEIGAKSSLFRGRLHVEPSVFHMAWNNATPDFACGDACSASGIRSSAVSNGFELAAQWQVTPRVTTALAIAYIDAHYTKTIRADGAVLIRRGDPIGVPPQVPSPWNVTGSIDYQFPLPRGLTANVRAEDIFRSRNPGPFVTENPLALSYNPGALPDPSTNLLNLRADVLWGSFAFALFANNVLDSQPTLGRRNSCLDCTIPFALTFRPRTVGITASWKF